MRTMIKKEVFGAPENPYFKRKVLNALPQKRRRGADWVVGAAYAVAFVIIACYWLGAFAGGDALPADRVSLAVMSVSTLALVISAVYQPLRRLLS